MPIAQSLFSYEFLYQFLCDTRCVHQKKCRGVVSDYSIGATGLLAVQYQVFPHPPLP